MGDSAQAIIIGVILAVSIGLSFFNEYRAERSSAALHDRVRHSAVVWRDGVLNRVDVTTLVPGDVIRLILGELVPADVRLITLNGLECNESILTGESTPAEKVAAPTSPVAKADDAGNLAFMGTVVSAGEATGVIYATGARAEFGRIAIGLGERHPETDFQRGLRRFSYLLLKVALTLTVVIICASLVLRRPLIDAALFGLAIAVGITPQLLPAVVSTSLASGSRRLARLKVLVKRLVCIEDLGDIDILITDKTGTLTDGRIELVVAVAPDGVHAPSVLRNGLMATDLDPSKGGVSGNDLDAALWRDRSPLSGVARLAFLPFDHERRTTSALIEGSGGKRIVVKGAPEHVLSHCTEMPDVSRQTLSALFADGRRIVAVASRPAPGQTTLCVRDETGLELEGFLVFADNPKPDVSRSLARLAALGIEVKVATGDNPLVAEKVCADIGLLNKGTVTGVELEAMSNDEFETAAHAYSIFARISPEQKARVISTLRETRRSVGFLGDGVNDALALHAADVGISVDSATDVAKDAADVVLLEKDLGVLAYGVAEGRRIFANTVKYVMMGTSSNFGNMFSAAVASTALPFLPMLPGQILLNNLLYDTSQLAIPTDLVDDDQLQVPAHWNLGLIRRFMLTFGPISSVFDFLTFGLMLGVLHAGADEFHTGWFVESLATQTSIIFVIRTRRVPFLRSRPGPLLALATVTVIGLGVALTISPLAPSLGFIPLPDKFFAALVGLTIAYLVLVEIAKAWFYSANGRPANQPPRTRDRTHRIHRRAARFSHQGILPLPT